VRAQDPAASPHRSLRRAVDYLAREVPAWTASHDCFSCHHNGDAARALYRALDGPQAADASGFRETTFWLQQPARWSHNGQDGEFNDRRLATVQFAAAAAAAAQVGLLETGGNAAQAIGKLLRADQDQRGSWQIQGGHAVGSPATYGTLLATVLGRQALATLETPPSEPAMAAATDWLARQEPRNVFQAAALLMAFGADPVEHGRREKVARSVELIRRGRDTPHGWGPYVNSRSEPFDTALVMLGLARCRPDPEITAWIAAGGDYLVRSQLADGSWPETTRPPGGRSYAQRVSTTAWATMALLTCQAASGLRPAEAAQPGRSQPARLGDQHTSCRTKH
jgi:hypothetical protein